MGEFQLNYKCKLHKADPSIMTNDYLAITVIIRNSAIADKPRDAFRDQSRSPNIVPFHMLGMVSY